MKVISFYNEKGGSGKTTLTALCASYFAYKLHLPVVCYDFDGPSYQLMNIRRNDMKNYDNIVEQIRNEPLKVRSNPNYPLYRMIGTDNDFYRVEIRRANNSGSVDDLDRLAYDIKKEAAATRDGYMFLDFPGSLRRTDLAPYLISHGVVDLVVFPIDSDRQTQTAALATYSDLRTWSKNPDFNRHTLFLWNKEAAKEHQAKSDRYSGPTEMFRRIGIPVAEKRIRDILIARRDSDTFGFIRNTLCWPDNNVKKAAGYLPQIFDEIRFRADGIWNEDIKEQIYGKEE